MKDTIESRIAAAFSVSTLKVVDESHKHAGHIDGNEVESHFRVGLVSDDFVGKTLIERQRSVYKLFADELKSGKIHMLALNIKTNEEIGN